MKFENKRGIVVPMTIFDGKRVEFVGVKLSAAEKSHLERIAEENDRPLSYVVRELALRGLVQYLQDRKLRITNTELALARHLLSGADTQPELIPGPPIIPVVVTDITPTSEPGEINSVNDVADNQTHKNNRKAS